MLKCFHSDFVHCSDWMRDCINSSRTKTAGKLQVAIRHRSANLIDDSFGGLQYIYLGKLPIKTDRTIPMNNGKMINK